MCVQATWVRSDTCCVLSRVSNSLVSHKSASIHINYLSNILELLYHLLRDVHEKLQDGALCPKGLHRFAGFEDQHLPLQLSAPAQHMKGKVQWAFHHLQNIDVTPACCFMESISLLLGGSNLRGVGVNKPQHVFHLFTKKLRHWDSKIFRFWW